MLALSCLVGGSVVGVGEVLAEDRALLVGVGLYASGDVLPGIELDVDMGRAMAGALGIKDSGIRVLADRDATAENFVSNVQSWLINGVSSGDRVFIYFSGHGTSFPDENGDEPDGRDEALCFHDLAIVDDDMQAIVGAIPSDDLIFFMDACHSGTATRSFAIPSLSASETKAKVWKGASQATYRSRLSVAAKSGSNYVSLAAADDEQQSRATPRGSVFTIAVWEALHGAAGAGNDMTFQQLRERAEASVQQWIRAVNAPQATMFNPTLDGNPAVFGRSVFRKAGSPTPSRPVWTQMETLVRDAGNTIRVETNGSMFRIGSKDALRLTIDLPGSGYLNVLNIDSQDTATVLFPNQFNPDNRLSSGSITIPTKEMAFVLSATPPAGDTLIVVLLTRERVNLYESGLKGGSPLATISPYGLRESAKFAPEGRSDQGASGAGMVLVKVVE
jgi:hypothetical protein